MSSPNKVVISVRQSSNNLYCVAYRLGNLAREKEKAGYTTIVEDLDFAAKLFTQIAEQIGAETEEEGKHND